MMQSAATISVLSTVNAPYLMQMDAAGLAKALKTGDIKKAQVGSFLMEVTEELQSAFANEHKISKASLQATAKTFSQWSGHEIQT
jgi:hypothetical protein